VDALLVLRGNLTELSAGYELRPLDRESRLSDWAATKQAVDSTSLTCTSQLSRFDEASSRYEKITGELAVEYSDAFSGTWNACAVDAMHRFAGDLAVAVLKTADPEEGELQETDPPDGCS
jgi:hypothetical protein